METELNLTKTGICKLNNNLPDNVCVHVYGMTAFPTYLEKLTDLWTGIVTPTCKDEDVIPWIMPYLTYEHDGKTCYLIWFFNNGDYPEPHPTDYVLIEKEIRQFLKDEEENTANVIADLRSSNEG